MAIFKSKGTAIKIGDGAMSEAFTAVAQATNIVWSGRTVDTEEITNHDSTDPAKKFASTLYSNGTVTFTIDYDGANTQHAALEGLSVTGDDNNFQYIVGANYSKGFVGIVTGFALDTPVGGLLKANVTIMVNGTMDVIS